MSFPPKLITDVVDKEIAEPFIKALGEDPNNVFIAEPSLFDLEKLEKELVETKKVSASRALLSCVKNAEGRKLITEDILDVKISGTLASVIGLECASLIYEVFGENFKKAEEFVKKKKQTLTKK